MNILPISLTEPTLARIRGLRQSAIARPGKLLSRARPGDRLWVREPFHLPATFDDLSPTVALALSAPITFAIDGVPDGCGRRRFARELPRDGHRMHLLVLAANTRRLCDLTDEDALGAGFATRADFARVWDQENGPARSITGDAIRWADNPAITWLHFRPVFEPLAPADFANRERAAACKQSPISRPGWRCRRARCAATAPIFGAAP